MRNRSINREILSLSVPAVIATVTTPLLGLTDTAFTGHMGGAVYLAAIALGGNVFNLLYWLMGFLRMGTSGLTAQAAGAGNRRMATLWLWRASLLALVVGTAVTAFQQPIISVFGHFLGADSAAWSQALTYLRILAWGAPAVMLSTALTGWFIGMHSSRDAMWMSVITDIANVATSAILVIGCHMKIAGVAIGTLVAQWGGAAAGLLLLRRFRPERVAWREIADPAAIKRFFSINTDIFLRTLCLIAVTLWFTRAGARLGTVTLAANALLMQFFILFSYFLDGVAYAAEAMAGNAAGALDQGRLTRVTRTLMRWGAWISIVFASIYFVCGEIIVSLLSDDPGVTRLASDFIPWVIAVPLVSASAFMWDGVCVGVTATRKMLLSMAAATAVYFATYYMLAPRMGNHGLWLAFTAYLATRSAVLWILRPDRLHDKNERS